MTEMLDYKPKHIMISDIFRSKIEEGVYSPGDKLFSDDEIARHYKIGRHTVAAGLNILAKEGLLERAPRRGTIVSVKSADPIYLLIPSPDFLEEVNNNSALFIRRLYKYLHLELMEASVPLITVPMSPTNNPNDIDEKFFQVIPPRSKVVCYTGRWGVRGLKCLQRKKCNVVFYDYQYESPSSNLDKNWKSLLFDYANGAHEAIRVLYDHGFRKPLLFLEQDSSYNELRLKDQLALSAAGKFFPDLDSDNIIIYEIENERPDEIYTRFGSIFGERVSRGGFDALFFNTFGLAGQVVPQVRREYSHMVIVNDLQEVSMAPELCHYGLDFAQLGRMTLELFDQPKGTVATIQTQLHNVELLGNGKGSKSYPIKPGQQSINKISQEILANH
jgi:DNA-binding transcriptional regulator YhcF (GntR family)